MNEPIYLNCAATSWPKPDCVTQRLHTVLDMPPAEDGRSTLRGASPAEVCRAALARLLDCCAEDIHFTSGATESANLIIAGLDLKGAHVIATAAEHNCVLRPLFQHPDRPRVSIAPCDRNGAVLLPELEAMITPDTRCLFVNHGSNVTGCVQDLAVIGSIARRHGLLLITDASQSLGCVDPGPLTAYSDIVFFTGHKYLFGPTGTGGYWLRPGTPLRIVKTGGTGSDGLWLTMPDGYRNREPGTPNSLGLAGLCAGTEYILQTGIGQIQQTLDAMRRRLAEGLSAIPGVRVLNAGPSGPSVPVVSFVCEGLAPSDLGYILAGSYGITLRTGYHCCPCLSAHTGTPAGTVRASFSYMTPDAAPDRLVEAVREIMEGFK